MKLYGLDLVQNGDEAMPIKLPNASIAAATIDQMMSFLCLRKGTVSSYSVTCPIDRSGHPPLCIAALPATASQHASQGFLCKTKMDEKF